MNYYNEIDKFAAAWLRNLIAEGLIPDGLVDERSIIDLEPSDLAGFRQCHFFAGIGGWSLALSFAGIPEDAEVWTGSCPCQPFSVAGQGKADNDERDLWPAFFRLISECRPSKVIGEQVGGSLGYQWLAGVRSQLEGSGYRVGAANLPACAVGAPHRRERLYWGAVADAAGCGSSEPIDAGERRAGVGTQQSARRGGSMADAVDDPSGSGLEGYGRSYECLGRPSGHVATPSFWSDAEWRSGADGKARRVKSGICLLSNGFPNRVGLLRGFGNAIVPQVAAQFISAFIESTVSA